MRAPKPPERVFPGLHANQAITDDTPTISIPLRHYDGHPRANQRMYVKFTRDDLVAYLAEIDRRSEAAS